MIDTELLAVTVDEYREVIRAMVAGLVSEGFTPEQARHVVVCSFQWHRPPRWWHRRWLR